MTMTAQTAAAELRWNRQDKNENIIVLVEPVIPYNTGNIGRTCVATDTSLHLVEPLGFELTDRYIKRAGMDYWRDVQLTRHADFATFTAFMDTKVAEGYQPVYLTTKAEQSLSELHVTGPCLLIFGREDRGLPEDFLFQHPQRCFRIPMQAQTRSLNLSNSVAIVLYEVLRRQGYPGLQ